MNFDFEYFETHSTEKQKWTTDMQNIVNAAEVNGEAELEALVNRSSAELLLKTLDKLGNSTMPKNRGDAYSHLIAEYNDMEAEILKMEHAKTQISTSMLYHTIY